MTTQKIETLMTGSEIFSSTSAIDAFFSSQVLVDNLVRQVRRKNGTVISMGDETWGKLFQLDIEYPCETTFDIWDWKTCDAIIYQNMREEVVQRRSQKKRTKMTIAHFLGLDHIGHSTSSVSDPAFSDKKQEISLFLQEMMK